MEWQRHQQIVFVCGNQLAQAIAEPGCQGQAVLVFEGLYQSIDREFVVKSGNRSRECGWALEAGATAFAECGFNAALRAVNPWVLRQVGSAGGAQQVVGCIGCAQQATAGHEVIGDAAEGVAQGLG